MNSLVYHYMRHIFKELRDYSIFDALQICDCKSCNDVYFAARTLELLSVWI